MMIFIRLMNFVSFRVSLMIHWQESYYFNCWVAHCKSSQRNLKYIKLWSLGSNANQMKKVDYQWN